MIRHRQDIFSRTSSQYRYFSKSQTQIDNNYNHAHKHDYCILGGEFYPNLHTHRITSYKHTCIFLFAAQLQSRDLSSSTWYTQEEEINKEMEVEAAGRGGNKEKHRTHSTLIRHRGNCACQEAMAPPHGLPCRGRCGSC